VKAVKAKKVVERDEYLEIDDPEVRAELDKLFERGERAMAEGKSVPLDVYFEELRMRLREGKPL